MSRPAPPLRVPIGRRIRDRRLALRITQAALADRLGISASYLNLIEHDKRVIGGKLLKNLADLLEISLDQLSGVEDARLLNDLSELIGGPGFEALEPPDAAQLVSKHPDWARAIIRLHRVHRDAQETVSALSDRLNQDPALMDLSHKILTRITAVRSFSEILEQFRDLEPEERDRFAQIIATESEGLGADALEMISLLDADAEAARALTPGEEVEDFLIERGNYFPALETAAEAVRADLDAAGEALTLAADRIAPEPDPAPIAAESTLRFQAARRIAMTRMKDVIQNETEDRRLTTPESRVRAREALGRYAAAAILFPYEAFLQAAIETRYDLEALCVRFGGGFEQIAHRLVTLRREGSEGVPFVMLKADPAGNIFKRFSIPGLRMPRYGGACPLWAVYGALREPGRTLTQLVETPDGARFLFIAQRIDKPPERYGAIGATHSVMLGCDAVYMDRIVYGDAFNRERETLVTPVGFSCRTCPRENCVQRARAAVL